VIEYGGQLCIVFSLSPSIGVPPHVLRRSSSVGGEKQRATRERAFTARNAHLKNNISCAPVPRTLAKRIK
jgi:hypothetical protein